MRILSLVFLVFVVPGVAFSQEKPIVGLIPKAQKPIKMDGKLDDWDGAFVTPVHVGHPDFANRGGQFLFLWDDQNLYIGLRCLDQKPAHVGKDNEIYNGDAVEFYLDTRRGDKLGAAQYGPGSLHMFWTPFTNTEVKPRMQVRPLPVFKDFKLQGAEVAAEKTAWGYTCEFKLPWANFPDFMAKVDEIIGIDCELCSSDGGLRVDRTFVYSGPTSVGTPSTFGRVKLVEKIADLGSFGRALLPMSLTRSTNYAWLYGTVCTSPTIEKSVAKLEGKILDKDGKVKKSSAGTKKAMDGGFVLWNASWELFDLPAGIYTLELMALDKAGKQITSRMEKVIHGNPTTGAMMDRGKAAALALNHARKAFGYPTATDDLVVIDKYTVETKQGWLFIYNTKSFVETGDVLKGLLGNGTILVRNDTGKTYQFASGCSIEEAARMLNQGKTPWK